jgi:hypothetical protein
MRRFFLALGVRVQIVARPLPDVLQPPEHPAQGVVGHPPVGEGLQGLLKQRDRPAHPWVAEVLWREGKQGLQQMLLVLVQQGMAAAALLLAQRGGVERLRVRLGPVVHALAGDAEHVGDVGGGAAAV